MAQFIHWVKIVSGAKDYTGLPTMDDMMTELCERVALY